MRYIGECTTWICNSNVREHDTYKSRGYPATRGYLRTNRRPVKSSRKERKFRIDHEERKTGPENHKVERIMGVFYPLSIRRITKALFCNVNIVAELKPCLYHLNRVEKKLNPTDTDSTDFEK